MCSRHGADRSLRRWHEARCESQNTSLLTREGEKETKVGGESKFLWNKSDQHFCLQGPDAVGLGVLEVKTEDNAEVGVPVLADVNEPTPIPTSVLR